MAIDYHSSFNSGELSPKMDGRSDLDVYRNGCRFLENFYVLPQGGVERRTGTEFIDYTNEDDGSEGDTSARLIPFIFSAEASYACEFGEGYIKVWSSDGTNVDVTGTVPYTAADVDQISFDQRFDLLFLAHPDHPTQTLSRTAVTPTFAIAETEFEYPPFLEENLDTSSTARARHEDWAAGTYYEDDFTFYQDAHYQCVVVSTTNSPPHADWSIVVDDDVTFNEGDPVTVISTEDIFTNKMDGGYFRIRHPLSEAKRLTSGALSGSGSTSDVVYVGAADFAYKITNEGANRGAGAQCLIESNASYDFTGANNIEATFLKRGVFTGNITTPTHPYVRIRKTNADRVTYYEINRNTNRSVDEAIVVATSQYSSSLDVSFSNWTAKVISQPTDQITEVERSTDDGQTWETFVILGDTRGGATAASFSYSSPSKEGATTFVRIKASGDSDVLIVNDSLYTEGMLKLDTYVSATEYTATIKNSVSSAGATSLWSEGAFSLRRGYARATRFHQDRLWLAGSDFDTATVYGSVTGDYYNFITGAESDLGIKRVIDTSEEIKWLIGKKFLFSGTSGGAIQITSADNKENVTADNIQTNPQSVFGASDIQGVLANDVIIYPQRNNLKLREMIYNWEEENFRSNDITILNDQILESGVKELFLQKQPDQVIWCVKEDGEAAILTYERQQEVVGWARVVTDGEIISGCSLPSATGEDEVWLCVKRLGKYLIEKFRPRADLDWYVDSAVEFDGGACVSADSFTVGTSPDFKITLNDADNAVSDGNKIRLENVTGLDWAEGRTFTVADRDANGFTLKTADGSGYINYYDITGEWPDIATVTGSGEAIVNTSPYTWDEDRTRYANSNNVLLEEYLSPKIWTLYRTSTEYYDSTTGATPPDTGWNIVTGAAPAPTSVIVSYSVAPTITGDYCLVQNTMSGLDHLEGETVQVVVDGSYAADVVVSSGTITLEDYGNTILAGLEYNSTLRTMPLEPVLGNRLSNSRTKASAKVIAKFYKTTGAKANEQGKQPNTFPALSTSDASGEPLALHTGDIRFFISSDWEREKIIEVKQDLPYPMTVLSLAIWAEVKGG